MPNHLDLPPELNSLIEKREKEDRRNQEAVAKMDASGESNDPTMPAQERRSGADRRAEES